MSRPAKRVGVALLSALVLGGGWGIVTGGRSLGAIVATVVFVHTVASPSDTFGRQLERNSLIGVILVVVSQYLR